jgi:hypothetical protein
MRCVLIVSVLCMFFSCKKEKNNSIRISGTMYNTNGGAASGVSMKVSYQEIQNASYSTAWYTAGTTTSLASGAYSIEFPAPRATSYKFLFSSPGHFTMEVNENAENISGETNRNFYIPAKAWFKIRIRNTSPVSGSDQIVFQNTSEAYGCSECCDNSIKILYGTTIDTTFTCLKAGGEKIKFSWSVTKASQSTSFTDSITTISHDTVYYDLTY